MTGRHRREIRRHVRALTLRFALRCTKLTNTVRWWSTTRALNDTCKFHSHSEIAIVRYFHYTPGARDTKHQAMGCVAMDSRSRDHCRCLARGSVHTVQQVAMCKLPYCQGEMASLDGRGHVSTFKDLVAPGGGRHTKRVWSLLHHPAAKIVQSGRSREQRCVAQVGVHSTSCTPSTGQPTHAPLCHVPLVCLIYNISCGVVVQGKNTRKTTDGGVHLCASPYQKPQRTALFPCTYII